MLWGKDEDSVAFPLVSFCDIPLSQASKHMLTYGNYALGLDKSWGMRNGVTPVLYCYANAFSARSISGIAKTLSASKPNDDVTAAKGDSAKFRTFSQFSAFIKQYEGPFIRPGRVVPSVRFYDERDWRFVPADIHGMTVLSKVQYLDFNQLKEANDQIGEEHVLGFEPSDIKYIIVATETEILPMIQSIERIKQKYTTDEVKILTSRIISAEQIISDF